ncbi:MAG: hypothetical protein IPP51_17135 [Bacteroidetes bacterium]|nr:hypothetical protein [Bacteroidota bacterium]
MKYCFLILFSLAVFSSKAQMSINWVNHFCCFDSIAPHSFSVPVNKIIDGDTLILAYWQDSTYRVRKIDLTTGSDLMYVEPLVNNIIPFYFQDVNYYGGDFFKLNGEYYYTGFSYPFPFILNSTSYLSTDLGFAYLGMVGGLSKTQLI